MINYRKDPDWAAKVLELSEGKGVDLVVDVVGAADLEKTMRCTAFAGTVVNVGLLGGTDPKATVDMLDLLFGAKTRKSLLYQVFMLSADFAKLSVISALDLGTWR